MKPTLTEFMESEVLPKENSAAEKMAAQLLSAARGDRDTAEKMAHGFLYNLIAAIDKESKFTGMKDVTGRPEEVRRTPPRQRPARGYDNQEPKARPTFSEFA